MQRAIGADKLRDIVRENIDDEHRGAKVVEPIAAPSAATRRRRGNSPSLILLEFLERWMTPRRNATISDAPRSDKGGRIRGRKVPSHLSPRGASFSAAGRGESRPKR